MIQTCLALLALLSQSAPARPEPSDRLVHEAVIAAPVEAVWAAFTTRAGIESWMAPHAEIDLRVGGLMRTNYNPEGAIGDPETIENTILSYEPLRMLSIKATKPPASFPFKDAIASMWSVVYFEPLDAARTRVRTVGLGYGPDEAAQKLRSFFERGNAVTLQKLQAKLCAKDEAVTGGGAADYNRPDRVLALLGRLAGDDFVGETTLPNGGNLRSHSQWRLGPDGRSLIGRGRIGGEDGMIDHGAVQIWLEPAGDAEAHVRFQNIDENGSISRGVIRGLDENTTEWDWDLTGPSGRKARFRVVIRVESAEAYRLTIFALPGVEEEKSPPREMVNLTFRRVKELPAEFAKMRANTQK